ncbi:MAG TPA: hypothetical protein VLF64_00465, partial [Candidatus Saccharimonadales bacterium]|nr:hypothetical protein [Candidatus Saccharimonadales bacterium]
MTNLDLALYGENPPSSPERAADPARYKFVFWEHDPANFGAAAAALYDCDVVAIENVGGPSQAERVTLTHDINVINSVSAGSDEKREARERIIASGDAPFLEMVEGITHEGQEICIIDTDENDPSYKDTQEFIDSGIALENAILELELDAELRQLLITNILAGVAMSRGRNPVLAEQIQAIGDARPGVLVGIGLGAGYHTQAHHMVARRRATARVFAGLSSGTNTDSETINFSYQEDITRQIDLLGRSIDNVGPHLMDRALLENIFGAHGFSTYAAPE